MRFQSVKHAGVFDSNRHGMAGETFGVGNDQFVRGIAKGIAQGFDFGLSGTSSSRRVGFVREEHGVGRHGVTVQTPPAFHVRDETVDHLADVFNIQTRPVVG